MDILTKSEVCEILRISDNTIDRLIAKGDLKAFKIGGAVRIDREAITEYLKTRVMGQGKKLKA